MYRSTTIQLPPLLWYHCLSAKVIANLRSKSRNASLNWHRCLHTVIPVLGLGAMISPSSLPCFHSNVVLRKIGWCSQWQFTWVHMEYVNKTKQPSVDTNQLYHTPPDSHNGIQHSIICTSLFTHNLYNQTIESPSLIYCHFKSCVLFCSLLQSPNK